MAKGKETVWEMPPHTRAKHDILKRYLQAWIPILSQVGFPEVLYVDGYAGPGIYKGGEPGSPIIALRAARDQVVQIKAEVSFMFVEKDPQRAQILEQQVAAERPVIPHNFKVKVWNDAFDVAFGQLLASYQSKGQRLPPTFAFVDPFGWDVPFSIIVEMMRYPSCEVLITFMYEEVNRFIGFPDQEKNFDKFFGCRDWREGIELSGPQRRNRFLHDLYLRQLRDAAGVQHVRSFQMRNDKDVTDYYLFYGTNSIRGLQRMKEAMWRVDTSGEFAFSDATNENQIVLFSEPRFEVLRSQIVEHFRGKETTVGEIEHFVVAETAFRETHYKRQVLKPMEQESELEVIDPPQGRGTGTYGNPRLRLRFR